MLNQIGNISDKRLLSWNEARTYTGLGRNKCREYCESIGAVKKIGGRVLFDRYKIDADLDK